MNIDFAKLAESIESVLSEYHIDYTHTVVLNNILPAWFEAKAPLLDIFSKHPNWNEETLSVLFKARYSRILNVDDAKDKAYFMMTKISPFSRDFVQFEDSIKQAAVISKYIQSVDFLANHSELCTQSITTDNHNAWSFLCPPDRDANRFFPVGLRTSRAFDRLFKYYGLDKLPNYDKDFAQLADTVSPLAVDRTACLSFHPCDYLLMSYGTGWESCHLIDGGGWQGGTWSYMLDKVTSIFYTLAPDMGVKSFGPDERPLYHREKVNRMVTCFQNKEILFSRLYPDYNDTQTRYTFRQLIQEIYSKCAGFPNLWQSPMGYREYMDHRLIRHGEGYMQYEDYSYSQYHVQLSVAKGVEPEPMRIGTYGICPITGEDYSAHRSMTSQGIRKCACCGEVIDDDDDYEYYGNRIYCSDCFWDLFDRCEECDEVYPVDDMYELPNGGHICEGCFNNYYSECSHCGDVIHNDEAIVDANGDAYCEYCAERYLTFCEGCEEYYPSDEVREVNGHYYCSDCYDTALEREEVRADA